MAEEPGRSLVRIAVTANSKLPAYEAAVRRAGGVPVVIEPAAPGEGTPAADWLRGCDGVLLTGGGDVDPARYGATAHPSVVLAEPGRDEFEIAVANAASAAGVPLLAICRGVQVLNVARGGTLVQDLPSEAPSAVPHRLPSTAAPETPAHAVRVTPETLLAHLVGGQPTLDVNSRHHQAIKQVGEGLRVVATAPDGIVEAVEDPALPFCIGVQWHPENLSASGGEAPLFNGLVRAAADAARRREPRA